MASEERLDRIEKIIEKQAGEIEKQNEGVRALIVVARTCLDSFTEVRASIEKARELHEKDYAEMRQAQAATEGKLNILIQAQMETERKLQLWIDRQTNSHE